MIDFITNKEKFENIEQRFNEIFRQVHHEGDNNFSEEFLIVFGFEFEIIFEEFFFEILKEVTNKFDEEEFYFYTVEPSPKDYFYHHFKKYSVLSIPKSASDSEFNKILMVDPGNSPADAIAINSSIITMFADSGLWACIGFRDENVALIAFKSEKVKEVFFASRYSNQDNFIKVT